MASPFYKETFEFYSTPSPQWWLELSLWYVIFSKVISTSSSSPFVIAAHPPNIYQLNRLFYLLVPFPCLRSHQQHVTLGDIKRTYPKNCEWNGIPPNKIKDSSLPPPFIRTGCPRPWRVKLCFVLRGRREGTERYRALHPLLGSLIVSVSLRSTTVRSKGRRRGDKAVVKPILFAWKHKIHPTWRDDESSPRASTWGRSCLLWLHVHAVQGSWPQIAALESWPVIKDPCCHQCYENIRKLSSMLLFLFCRDLV